MLSTQFSQNMTEIHSKVPETIELASTLPELRRQLESWQLIEKNNNGLGRVLEAMVASQRKLMGLGVQVRYYSWYCIVHTICVQTMTMQRVYYTQNLYTGLF